MLIIFALVMILFTFANSSGPKPGATEPKTKQEQWISEWDNSKIMEWANDKGVDGKPNVPEKLAKHLKVWEVDGKDLININADDPTMELLAPIFKKEKVKQKLRRAIERLMKRKTKSGYANDGPQENDACIRSLHSSTSKIQILGKKIRSVQRQVDEADKHIKLLTKLLEKHSKILKNSDKLHPETRRDIKLLVQKNDGAFERISREGLFDIIQDMRKTLREHNSRKNEGLEALRELKKELCDTINNLQQLLTLKDVRHSEPKTNRTEDGEGDGKEKNYRELYVNACSENARLKEKVEALEVRIKELESESSPTNI